MVSKASQRKLQRKQGRQEKKQRIKDFHSGKKNVVAEEEQKPVVKAPVQPIKKVERKPVISRPIVVKKELSELEKAQKLKGTNSVLYHALLKDGLIVSADSTSTASSMAKDDLDARRYAKKLKLKSSDSISSAFKKDGLDFILDAVKSGKSSESASEDDDDISQDEQEEFSHDENEQDFNDDEIFSAGEDIDEEDLSDESEDDIDSDGNNIEETEEDSSSAAEEIEPETEENEFKPSVQKYVPRMMRLQQEQQQSKISAPISKTAKSEDYMRVQKQIQGHLNKLSEANIESIFSSIEQLYSSSRRHDVTEILSQRIMDLVSTPTNLAESFVINYACILKLVYCCVGTDICAQFVQELVNKYTESYQSLLSSNIEESEGEEMNKQCLNFMVLICYLYNFNVISSVLLFDILMDIIKSLKDELQIDLVLKVIRISGFKLRSEDPGRLKGTIMELQTQSSHIESQSVRLKFMIEQVNNLKNNKGLLSKNNGAGDNSDIVERLKKFARNFFKKRGTYEQEPLRCSLDDIQYVETKGKWWVVGAAWVGRQHADETLAPLVNPVDEAIQNNHKLLALAKKLGINMEVRRNIFVILMSSEDYIDAFERLMKLGLKSKQEREIVRMITYCCGLEKRYNPFYSVLAQHLCRHDHSHKITFQFTLWDFLKQITAGEDQFSLRRLTNIAMFYSSLIENQALSLSILKTLDFAVLIRDSLRSELSPLCVLIQIMLTSLLVKEGETDDKHSNESIAHVFGKLATYPDLEMLRQGLRLTMTNLLKKRIDYEMPAILEPICVIKRVNYKHVVTVIDARISLARQCMKSPTQMI